jgi:hypothetical protein
VLSNLLSTFIIEAANSNEFGLRAQELQTPLEDKRDSSKIKKIASA